MSAQKELTYDARQLLDYYTEPELMVLVRFLIALLNELKIVPQNVPIPSRIESLEGKRLLLLELAAGCLDNERVLKELYRRMSDLEKALLEENVWLTSKFTRQYFLLKYESVPKITIQIKRNTLSLLTFFMTKTYLMPESMRTYLKRIIPKPRQAKVSYLSKLPSKVTLPTLSQEVPLAVHLTELPALTDVKALFHLINRGSYKTNPTRNSFPAELTQFIENKLSCGDFYPKEMSPANPKDLHFPSTGIRTDAWGYVIHSSPLLTIQNKILKLTDEAVTYLKEAPHKLLAEIWKSWISAPNNLEIYQIQAVRLYSYLLGNAVSLSDLRRQCAELLASLEEGKWLSIEEFKLLIKLSNKNINYISDPNYTILTNGYNTTYHPRFEDRKLAVQALNLTLFNIMLLEFAASFGLIDVALVFPWGVRTDISEYTKNISITALSLCDGLAALRVTPLGSFILGNRQEYNPIDATTRSTGKCIITEDHQLIFQSGITTSEEAFLDHFANRIAPLKWQLDANKLIDSISEGMSLDYFSSFIKSHLDKELPQSFQELLILIEENMSRLRDDGDARIITCADPEVATYIISNKKFQKLCYRAGQKILIVPKEREALFRKRIREIGLFLPPT